MGSKEVIKYLMAENARLIGIIEELTKKSTPVTYNPELSSMFAEDPEEVVKYRKELLGTDRVS